MIIQALTQTVQTAFGVVVCDGERKHFQSLFQFDIDGCCQGILLMKLQSTNQRSQRPLHPCCCRRCNACWLYTTGICYPAAMPSFVPCSSVFRFSNMSPLRHHRFSCFGMTSRMEGSKQDGVYVVAKPDGRVAVRYYKPSRKAI